MSSLDLSQLTPNSTLSSLVSHNYQTNIHTLGQAISQKFQNQPELPGVIILDGRQMVGMISQRKFLERMSLPYASEIHLKRPIQVFLNLVRIEPLQLPIDFKIEQAARIALSRSTDLIYEPVVLTQPDQLPRLLDIRDLLLAQNQILTTINNKFEQQQQQANKDIKKIEKEVEKNKLYAQMLTEQQVDYRKQQQVLEAQQIRLNQQAKQINDFSRQLVRIGQFLSLERIKSFGLTYEGVSSISHTAQQIVSTGNFLIKELESVDDANNLITNVSKQVRHLALQAAVAANKSGRQLTEFSYIAQEIRSLGSKTFEASTQLNQIASRFKNRIPELTQAAQLGEATAHSVMQKIEETQNALIELEKLINENIHDQQPGLNIVKWSSTEIKPEHPTTRFKLRKKYLPSEQNYLPLSNLKIT